MRESRDFSCVEVSSKARIDVFNKYFRAETKNFGNIFSPFFSHPAHFFQIILHIKFARLKTALSSAAKDSSKKTQRKNYKKLKK